MSITRNHFDASFPSSLATEFEPLFDSPPLNSTQVARRDMSGPSMQPRMDLQENPGNNTVMATFELPGMDGSDVSIDVDNNVLTVSGMSKISGQAVDHGHVVRERRLGRFSRSFALPQGVTRGDVQAEMYGGVLTVTYPKSTS